MLELLGLLGGGVFRIIPLVMDFFKQKQDMAHELRMLAANLEMEKQRGLNRDLEIQAMTAQAVDTRWADGLVEALRGQMQVTGDKWLDRLNVSVRPILTYWWTIFMYTGAKIVMIVVAWQADEKLANFAPLLLTDFDRGVVGSIIGFWFVDRALRKQNQ